MISKNYEDEDIRYNYLTQRTVSIIGVTSREGQDKDGPEKAPGKIRDAGLLDVVKSLGWNINDYGDINDENIQLEGMENSEGIAILENSQYKYSNLRHAFKIGAVNKRLSGLAKEVADRREFLLTLGGDHGIATGSISGLKASYPNLKVIWIDAHGDANTPETSPSGNYHGMPVAHLLGWLGDKTVPGFDWFHPCLKSEDIVFIGLRDLDGEEKKNLKKHNIKCFTMHEVLKYGIGSVVQMSLEHLNRDDNLNPVHISFDVDGIDPIYAYGTGTKARGGLSYAAAHFILREVALSGCLVSLDLVEINPMLDKIPREQYHGDNKYISNTTETIALGVELVASALGHTLL